MNVLYNHMHPRPLLTLGAPVYITCYTFYRIPVNTGNECTNHQWRIRLIC
nr:MAG TPA: hypothetical protein [Caudoviricetes sp.]